ncbi:MAG: transcription elongation factor GreA [Parcubacteria group bacterium]|jgi:transcription elongation factor GreA|nr:transcription elongation factor GreA [Parcubacteria group bacterium]|tara:strand:+ start:6545 stop:7021 length:477 start_codon:yes stop_codon:yes gene_type:complete
MKYISAEGLEKLKQEVKKRKTIKRQEVARRLEEAKALGDLSENSEYLAAKEDRSFNEGKILELEGLIEESVLIKPARKGQKKIRIGSVIQVKLVTGHSGKINQKQTFMIVGFQEADPGQGKISNESPLGQVFLGREVGDIIEAETPKGKVRYKIVGIE